MSEYILSADNDLAFLLTLKKANAAGALVPFLGPGSGTAHIALNADSDVVLDADLTCAVTHTANGKWIVPFDAAKFTSALLDAHFTEEGDAYCVVNVPGAIRRAIKLIHRKAVIVEAPL